MISHEKGESVRGTTFFHMMYGSFWLFTMYLLRLITLTKREPLRKAIFHGSGSKATFHLHFLKPSLNRWTALSVRAISVLLFFPAFLYVCYHSR